MKGFSVNWSSPQLSWIYGLMSTHSVLTGMMVRSWERSLTSMVYSMRVMLLEMVYLRELRRRLRRRNWHLSVQLILDCSSNNGSLFDEFYRSRSFFVTCFFILKKLYIWVKPYFLEMARFALASKRHNP